MQNIFSALDSEWRVTDNFRQILLLIVAIVFVGSPSEAHLAEPQQDVDIVARAGEHEVNQAQFKAYFEQARRQEFYHRTPPQDELQAFRIKTINELINRLLLQDEALRRGIQPNEDNVQKSIDRMSLRYKGNTEFEANREEMIASLRGQLEAASRIEQLEATTREVGDPAEGLLQAYYEANPDAFTEPRQRKVSLILVQVDPSSTQEVREEALAKAQRIVERLNTGEEFGMLAEALSDDISAENGGSMGWMHEGLLNDQAEIALSKMAAGDISEPVRVLEGYAILRLDEIKEPQLHSLDHVRVRATALWKREAGEQAWQDLIESLRSQVEIEILDPDLEKTHTTESV